MITDELPLLDQHCHGVRAADLDRAGVELLLTESDRVVPGRSPFDSMLGAALRRLCGPLLDLEPHATTEDYLERRASLGWREVTRRLLRAAGTSTWLVDTGLTALPAELPRTASRAGGPLPGHGLTGPAELAELGGGRAHEVVRLETVAEQVAATGVPAAELAAAVERELRTRAAGAAGFKSVVAYRCGLEVPGVRPSPTQITAAARRWLSGVDGRMTDPALLAWLVHLGAELGAELGLPLQLHTGFGDPDVHLREADPLLLTDFLRSTADTGLSVVLLHCWPFHRGAGYLAHAYPHVLVDLGLAIPHVGARATAVLAETLEVAPFSGVCFSSDGFGLPELHHLGAALWRERLGRLLDDWIADDVLTVPDAERLARAIASGNAARAYGLADQ